MKIYTKTGDAGNTSLVGGTRVAKDSPRLEAYGTIDEASAHIAYLRDNLDSTEVRFTEIREDLMIILRNMMTASAILASEPEVLSQVPQIKLSDIEYLEHRIDAIQAGLPAIDKFTIPGGHPYTSLAHIARTVTRRAEREVVKVTTQGVIAPMVGKYLNRLSDYLYLVGREITNEYNVKEVLWIP